MTRNILCTLVEVPEMAGFLTADRHAGFQDLVPWADPYIVSLVQKLARAAQIESEDEGSSVHGEAPPPLVEQPWIPEIPPGGDRLGRRDRGRSRLDRN